MLILLRHGRTHLNAGSRLQGRTDAPLDEHGRHQAQLAAATIGEVDLVVSSPLARARQTADAFGLPVTIDERWVELDYGLWDGSPIAEVELEDWERWRNDLHFAPPRGESIASVGARVRSACQDLAEAAQHKDVLVVSHVSPIKAAICWALGVGDEHAWNIHLTTGSVSRIRTTQGRTVLVSCNEVP